MPRPAVRLGDTVLYRVARTGTRAADDWSLRYNYSDRRSELVWRPAVVVRIWSGGQWLNLRVLADGPAKLDQWRCSIQHWSEADDLECGWAGRDEDPQPLTGDHPKMCDTQIGRLQDTSV